MVLAGGEALRADSAVVTVPLGVLKAGGIAFDPPLPPWKADAIRRLGFGALNKVRRAEGGGGRGRAAQRPSGVLCRRVSVCLFVCLPGRQAGRQAGRRGPSFLPS